MGSQNPSEVGEEEEAKENGNNERVTREMQSSNLEKELGGIKGVSSQKGGGEESETEDGECKERNEKGHRGSKCLHNDNDWKENEEREMEWEDEAIFVGAFHELDGPSLNAPFEVEKIRRAIAKSFNKKGSVTLDILK